MPSEKITLHEIKCPNCGATISRFNAFAVTCRCPNCDKIFQILGGAHRRDIDRPERIFPFRITKEEFRKKFSDCFWREFSREYGEKVSAEAEFGDEAPFYVAAYFFDERVPMRLLVRLEPQEGLPSETTLDAHATVTGTLPATDSRALPPGLAEATNAVRYVHAEAEFFRPEYFGEMEDCNIVDSTLPADFIWEKKVVPKIQNRRDFGSTIPDWEAFLNRKVSGVSRVEVENFTKYKFAYVSVWRLAFTFNGKTYYYACDGSGRNEEFSFPPDPIREREERERREAERKAEWERKSAEERKQRQEAAAKRARKEEKSTVLMGIALMVALVLVVCFIVTMTMLDLCLRDEASQAFVVWFGAGGLVTLFGITECAGVKAVGLGCLTALLCLFGLIAAIVILCI